MTSDGDLLLYGCNLAGSDWFRILRNGPYLSYWLLRSISSSSFDNIQLRCCSPQSIFRHIKLHIVFFAFHSNRVLPGDIGFLPRFF